MKSHVRLAHPDFNKGAKLLRRGYNFVDGSNGLGQLSAGLFFIAYQRDPRSSSSRSSAPSPEARRTMPSTNTSCTSARATFACPPGVGPKGYWGERSLYVTTAMSYQRYARAYVCCRSRTKNHVFAGHAQRVAELTALIRTHLG